MFRLTEQQKTELAALCAESHVRRLDLFGSATTDRFDEERSDLDFFVELDELPPAAYATAYFKLREGLEALLKRPVDLVTPVAMRNPYFAESLARSRLPVYAA